MEQISAFVSNFSIRYGANSVLAAEKLSPDEIVGVSELALSGTVCGFTGKDSEVQLVHTIDGRPAINGIHQVPPKGNFTVRVLLRHGLNRFSVVVRSAESVSSDDRPPVELASFSMTYKSQFREWSETVAIAFVLALIIRGLVLQAFWIPTGSMENTLLGEKRDPPLPGGKLVRSGDRIIVNRFAYLADFSLDGKIPFLPKIWFRKPARGDIVVFLEIQQDPTAPAKDFIKRVIGVSGDLIEGHNGVVSVNGVPLEEPYIKESHRGSFPSWKVPADHIFVMGDNRNNSQDSRVFGPVPLDNLKGQAVLVYMPFNRFQLIRSVPHQNVPAEYPDR